MKSFSFENQGTNTYLVYALDANESMDSMSLGMLTNNKIPGLAPAIFTQMDTKKYIKYNVSSHISVKQFFSGAVNKKRLIGVFNGIVNAMLSAEDYMIDVNSILVDLDYIFADVSTCETFLICLPIANSERTTVDLGMFFKNIMFSTQFDQTENCDHVAKIMNYLNSTPVFSLSDFKELLNSLDTQTVATQPTVSTQQPVVSSSRTVTQQTQPQVVIQNQMLKQPENVSAQPVAAKSAVVKTTQVKTPAAHAKSAQTQPVQAGASAVNTQSVPQEKKMSMLNLLMHYNKENAEIYKAQKAAQKGAKQPQVLEQKKQGYAVPGQSNASAPIKKSFAVPSQPSVPVQTKTENGFAIPGQPTPVISSPGQPKITPQKPSTQPAATAPSTVQPVVPVQRPVYEPPAVPQGQSMNFGETTVLGGANVGETTVLGASPVAAQPRPHLVRSKNNEKINLNKPVFRVGKEKSYVDYFIGDNTAISRSHANFITRDGEYFVVDTNSTNHTYVNGTMVQSNVEAKLSHGDKVCLANEDFEFKLY